MHKTLRVIASIGAVLLLWHLGQRWFQLPDYILPQPLSVIGYMIAEPSLLAYHSLLSLAEIFCGLTLGAFIAIRLVMLSVLVPRLKAIMVDTLVALQAIPIFVLLPLFLLWFGHGFGTKIMVIGLSCFFPIAANFLQGINDCPQYYLDQAAIMGARRSKQLWHILLPASLPQLLNGVRIAAVHAPITVIAADWIGATEGLGYLIMLSSGRLQTELLFACIILICTLSLAFNAALAVVTKKIIYWRPE